jgi:dTDP-alpha-D-glucose dehydrogenase
MEIGAVRRAMEGTPVSSGAEGPPSVAIVGFGYVGTILASYLASKGVRVVAIESREDVVRSLDSGVIHIREAGLSEILLPQLRDGSIAVTTSRASAASARVVIVTVGTPLGRGLVPDLSALRQVARELVPHLRKGQLVVVKSTVPPGTTRGVIAPILETSGLTAGVDFDLSYCPERLSEGNALAEVPTLPVVVSGINSRSARAAISFWESVGLGTAPVQSLEAAELVKLADNVWIDLTVALTNELARVCERMGVDALDVIRAANTLRKGTGHVNYLHPGIGVGGSCLTKDPWFFADIATSLGTRISLPQSGREVNEQVPLHVAMAIREELDRRSGAAPRTVAILGYAFKGGTGDTRNTPVRPIVGLLRESGVVVRVYDPWVGAVQINEQVGLTMDSDLAACVHDASCVFVATNHPEFRGLTPDRLRGAAPNYFVYDGWHVLDPALFVSAGIDYLSPGKNLKGERT